MKRLLVIDDSEDFRELLKELFEAEGFEVNCAVNGKVALDLLRDSVNLPNLIILDLMMPVMDGIEFRAAQLADQKISAIPVVIMTADDNPDKLEKLPDVAFIKKSGSLDVMVDAIKANCS